MNNNIFFNYIVLVEKDGQEVYISCKAEEDKTSKVNLTNFYNALLQQCWKHYKKGIRWTYRKACRKVLGKDNPAFRGISVNSKREFHKMLERAGV